MSLDQILFELEQGQPAGRGGGGGLVRDPERYYLSVFGEPSATATWGWRVEGHHVSVNVTMDKGKFVASTPTFLGANPADSVWRDLKNDWGVDLLRKHYRTAYLQSGLRRWNFNLRNPRLSVFNTIRV